MRITLIDFRAQLTQQPTPAPLTFQRAKGRELRVVHRQPLSALGPAVWSSGEDEYDEVMILVEELLTATVNASLEKEVHMIAIDFRGWPTDAENRRTQQEIMKFVISLAKGLPVYRLERGEGIQILALPVGESWIASESTIEAGRKFDPVRGFILTQPGEDLGHFGSTIHVVPDDGSIQYYPTSHRHRFDGDWCLAYSKPPVFVSSAVTARAA